MNIHIISGDANFLSAAVFFTAGAVNEYPFLKKAGSCMAICKNQPIVVTIPTVNTDTFFVNSDIIIATLKGRLIIDVIK